MRIITANVNGIRSAAKKGVFPWLAAQNADVICLQETKAQEHQLEGHGCLLEGYHCHFHDAKKPGYAGVAVYSRAKPDRVLKGFKVPEFDDEGRYLEARFGDLSVISLYLPSGSSGEHRQASKFRFLEAFIPQLQRLKRSGRKVILCGDWNIAHRNLDLRNWKSNQKNSGFLPEERAWLDRVFGSLGFVDSFREIKPEVEQYTWWSNRGQARAKNVGWRIDYQVLSPNLAGTVRDATVYTGAWFSDHAPLTVDYEF